MYITNNSRSQMKMTIGLVLLLVGLMVLAIVPSSSGIGPARLASGNRNSSSTQAGRSEAPQQRQPDANTIGYHFTATTAVDLSAGLIGHWPLNGNADDVSGNGHNGTISGATPTTGMFGGAYNFNGSASIDVGDLDFSSGEYTVSGWIRTDLAAVTNSYRDWISKVDIPTGSGPFMLDLGEGRSIGGGNGPGFVAWNNGSTPFNLASPNLNYRDGNWHHVAATYQNGNQQLYADGVLVGTSAYPGPLPSNSRSVVIGGIEGFGPYHHRWVGDIDEVSIYSRVLNASEITQLSNGGAQNCTQPSAGLVSWWPGDGNANDVIGDNQGTLQNGATFTTGKVGQAFSLDGVNDYVSIANTPSLDFRTGDFTIELWVQFNSFSRPQVLFIKMGGGFYPNNQGYLLEFDSAGSAPGFSVDTLRFLVRDTTGNENDLNAPATLQTGTWYHVAGVRQGNTNLLYLNGSLIGQKTSGTNVDTRIGGETNIGKLERQPDPGASFRFLSGAIDEIKVYNRALTALEIGAIHTADSAGNCKPLDLSACQAELATANQTIQNQQAQIAQLQNQVSALSATNASLQSQVANLNGQVSQLQSQLNQINTALSTGVNGTQADFRRVFNDPTFTIPGSTPLEQYQNLVNAIVGLNRGQKQAVYKALGGKP